METNEYAPVPEYVELVPVESSAVAYVGYANDLLVVILKGRYRKTTQDWAPRTAYGYSGVTSEQFEAFINAESIGRALGTFRADTDLHPCSRFQVPESCLPKSKA